MTKQSGSTPFGRPLNLANPAYLPLAGPEGQLSYGGSQLWFAAEGGHRAKTLKGYGCGLIALADWFLYRARQGDNIPLAQAFLQAAAQEEPGAVAVPGGREHPAPLYTGSARSTSQAPPPAKPALGWAEYLQYLRRCSALWGPWVHWPGVTGFGVANSFNRAARQNGLPLRGAWGGIKTEALPRAIAAQLRQDLPVILGIGPNFPPAPGCPGVPFHIWNGSALQPGNRPVAGHFITVTGLLRQGQPQGGLWLRAASWGREYYIEWAALQQYIHRHIPLFSSILRVQPA